jgi:hypothetical protein
VIGANPKVLTFKKHQQKIPKTVLIRNGEQVCGEKKSKLLNIFFI